MTDDLTIAYIAIGAHSHIRELQQDNETDRRLQLCIDAYGGELGLIGAILVHAERVDTLYPDDFSGVWAYEVAEEFGAIAVNKLLADESIHVDEIVNQLIGQTEVQRG